MLLLLLAGILVALYVFTPQITAQFPQLDPYLSAYVTWVDNQRIWLDGWVKGALNWLDAATDNSAN